MSETSPFSLNALLAALREAGLAIGVAETLRAQGLVEAAASKTAPRSGIEPAVFRGLLAAAVVRNVEDRATFDRVLDAWDRRGEVVLELPRDQESNPEGGPNPPLVVRRPEGLRPQQGGRWKKWRWPAAAVGLLLGGALVWLVARGSGDTENVSDGGTVEEDAAAVVADGGAEHDAATEVEAGEAVDAGERVVPSRPSQYRTRELIFTVTKPESINPWLFGGLILGATALALGLGYWLRNSSWLPRPEKTIIRPGPTKAALQPLDSRAPGLLGAVQREDLAFAVDRFVREEPSPDLDVPRSVDATVREGGIPSLVFRPRTENRSVWLWTDAASTSPLVARFVAEVHAAIAGAGLPCERAHYWMIPDVLEHNETGPLYPHDLDEAAHGSVVLLVTDGVRVAERLARSAALAKSAPIFRRLARWPRAALVVTSDDGRRSLEELTERFGLTILAPEGVDAFLGGQDPGPAEPAPPLGIVGDLRVWAAACALSEHPVDTRSALALRGALGLRVAPWALDVLSAEIGDAGGGLMPAGNQRAAWLSWLGRATDRGSKTAPIPELSQLGRALSFWLKRLDPDNKARAAEVSDKPWEGTEAERELRREVALLLLWSAPDRAAVLLHQMYGAKNESERRAVLAGYAARARATDDPEVPEGVVLLPWLVSDRKDTARVVLEGLGLRVLSNRHEKAQLEPPSRVLLALGLTLGVVVSVGVVGLGKWLLRPTSAPTCEGPPGGWCEVVEEAAAPNAWRAIAKLEGLPAQSSKSLTQGDHVQVVLGGDTLGDDPPGAVWHSTECPYREETVNGMVFVRVCGGTFKMGSDNDPDAFDSEKPAHTVTVSTFWIGKYEVSNAQYRVKHRDHQSSESPTWPVSRVDWTESKAFCESLGFRLPTEAEWEYAARGPEARKYPWGAGGLSKERAAYDRSEPVEVTALADAGSPFGTANQIGNVWEWVEDCYDSETYSKRAGQSVIDPRVVPDPSRSCDRVLRGGSFRNPDPRNLRSANRNWNQPEFWYDNVGFRCVRLGSRQQD